MATKNVFTAGTKLQLTAKGLAYTGRTGTLYSTNQQWVHGCLTAFGKNPKAGAVATFGQILAAYQAGNANNMGNGPHNISYHVNNGRLKVVA